MHTFRVSTSILITLSGMLILSAGGCEDSAAKQRDQVQAQLVQIRSDLQKTYATGGESYEADLNKIVSQLSSVSGGEPGQQAAKSLLAANTLREVAMLKIAAASDIEAQHRASLGAVNARIDAAMRIQSLATGLESIDAAKRRSELQSELQQAMDGVNAAQAKISELESPINERTSQNTTQKAEIEQLRVQVGDLLKQAQSMGYSAGFETYKQATQVGRQADKIEYEVSNREIDLEHELNPQHKAAQSQKAQLEGLAQAIESAQTELDAFATAASGDAQTSHAKVAELGKKVTEDLNAIKAKADSDLKTAYDDGLAALQKAAASALAASTGGPEASAGRTLACSISESMVRLHLMAAHGLSDRIATLQRIKASNGAIAFNGVDSQIKELSDAREQHLAAAKTSLDEASHAADSIAGESGEVLALRKNLQALSAALSGKPAPVPAAPSAGDGDGAAADDAGAAAAAPMALGAGAESPEALAESLKLVTTPSAVEGLFELAIPPSDAKKSALLQLARSLSKGMGALDSALQSKFTKGVKDISAFGGGMTEDLPIVTDAVADTAAAEPSITVTFANGKTATAPISQVNGRWYVGKESDDGAGLMALVQMDEQDMAATGGGELKMIGAMSEMLTKVAADVEAGSFETFEAFEAQFAERMQQAMAAAMGLPAGAGGVEPNK